MKSMIYQVLTRFTITLIGICILAGCIKEYPKDCPIGAVLTFEYLDKNGSNLIEADGRVQYIDYYIFDSSGMLYAKHRVAREEGYKSVHTVLPEGEITVVAWANLTENDLLPAKLSLPLNEWTLALSKNGNKYDATGGKLYHASKVLSVSKSGSKKFTLSLKHRHANIAIRLEGSGVKSESLYECELVTGENIYGFKQGVKLGTGNNGYARETFKALDQSSPKALLRTYRLFEEIDNHATIQLYKDGVALGEPKKLSQMMDESMPGQQIYDMHEQNISLYARIDKDENISFSIQISTDWDEGGEGFIPFER